MMDHPVVRLGLVGFGAAGQAFLPALDKHPGFKLVAIAEPLARLREGLQQRLNVAIYDNLDDLLQHPDLDAVYLATPTELHASQVVMCAQHGKHVLVEKPMATGLSDAQTMVTAAEDAKVVLLVGHSHSFDRPVQAMRDIIDSGELGPVRMVNTWCFTDWMYRPRRSDELDVAKGGGVTFRQGAHQFDILRWLCAGQVSSVKARAFDFDPERSSVGAHTVFLDFDNGAAATAVYSGYAGMSSMDLGFPISEWGFAQSPEDRPWARKLQVALDPQQERLAKEKRAVHAIPDRAPFQPFFGLTVVHCEKGEFQPRWVRVRFCYPMTSVPEIWS
jgi:phthalate 4,5-cis-dihydrodiol dehydrogenase